MKAVKGNKVYDIAEQEKHLYISRGFDIVDDNGEVIAYGKGKSVPFGEYEKVKSELEKIKAAESETNSKPPKKPLEKEGK